MDVLGKEKQNKPKPKNKPIFQAKSRKVNPIHELNTG